MLNIKSFTAFIVTVLLLINCQNENILSEEHIPFLDTIDVSKILNYPIEYCSEWPNNDNTGIKGVGLEGDILQFSNSLHIRKDNRIISNGVDLDFNSTVGQKIKIDNDNNEIVIESLNVYDGINIYEDCNTENIIIRKCYITEGLYGITIRNTGITKILIEDCTILSIDGSQRKGILARDCIIRRCNISNYQDGVYISENVVLDGNYIHSLYTFDGAHSDATQCSGPGTVLMINNYFDAIGHNACLMSSNQESNLTLLHLEHNYIAGGNYSIYIVEKADGAYVLRNHLIKNNVFQKESYGYGYIAYEEGCNIKIIGNVDEFGDTLSNNNNRYE